MGGSSSSRRPAARVNDPAETVSDGESCAHTTDHAVDEGDRQSSVRSARCRGAHPYDRLR
jgi:hypothetical protein